MIISHIIGGLGNQMFQYATGRALSLERGVPLYLDTQDFAGYSLHYGFELNKVFNISTPVASADDLWQVLGWRSFALIRKLLLRKQLARFRGDSMIIEPQVAYWPEIGNIPNNSYLMGYWLTEKYFKNVEEHIRSDFIFRGELSDSNKLLDLNIQNCNSVSIHVRRGDIAQNPDILAVHGLCGLDYYKKAVSYIAERIQSPNFYIFSDDLKWVRDNLKINFPCYFVDQNMGQASFNDMRLMSLCKHNITANSTFSWWGAWLNNNQNKIVISPKQWFAAQIDCSYIVPSAWVRM